MYVDIDESQGGKMKRNKNIINKKKIKGKRDVSISP